MDATITSSRVQYFYCQELRSIYSMSHVASSSSSASASASVSASASASAAAAASASASALASSHSATSSCETGSRFALCPICGEDFHVQLLLSHAAKCGISSGGSQTKASVQKAKQPLLPRQRLSQNSRKRLPLNAFGCLRPPGPKDIRPTKRRRALDAPDKEFSHLIVLDFEWTADNTKRMLPYSEIIEWSCVLVETTRPAKIVSELQIYVKPHQNPVLTKFSKGLTGITQKQVDEGVSIQEAILQFEDWMRMNGLNVTTEPQMGSGSKPKLDYAIVTWSDADLGGTLPTQMRALGIPRRPHFDAWVNLKIAFESVYKRSSRGLQKCVESIGLSFNGRAHSGLVDARNTANIALDMLNRQNYRGFVRTTRFLKDDWGMVGSKKRDRS